MCCRTAAAVRQGRISWPENSLTGRISPAGEQFPDRRDHFPGPSVCRATASLPQRPEGISLAVGTPHETLSLHPVEQLVGLSRSPRQSQTLHQHFQRNPSRSLPAEELEHAGLVVVLRGIGCRADHTPLSTQEEKPGWGRARSSDNPIRGERYVRSDEFSPGLPPGTGGCSSNKNNGLGNELP